jgi:hypothetical protein
LCCVTTQSQSSVIERSDSLKHGMNSLHKKKILFLVTRKFKYTCPPQTLILSWIFDGINDPMFAPIVHAGNFRICAFMGSRVIFDFVSTDI